MTRRRTRFFAAALSALALASVAIGGATAARNDLTTLRAATARFHSTDQAAAAGFGAFPDGVPLHECISSLDNTGAMGFHWLNPGNLNTNLDPATPQVLVYEPSKTGKLKLVAVEYVIFQAAWFENHPADSMPMLFGEEFMPNNGQRFQIPPFFALHVWLYKSNPSGMFAPFNPNVSCGAASAAADGGRTTAAVSADVARVSGDSRRATCRIPVATA